MPLAVGAFKWLALWRTSSSVPSASASTKTRLVLVASTISAGSVSLSTGAGRSPTERGTAQSAGGPSSTLFSHRVSSSPTLWRGTPPSRWTPSSTLRGAPTPARTTRRSSSSASLTKAWCASSATSRRYTSSTKSPPSTRRTRRYRSVGALRGELEMSFKPSQHSKTLS